LKRRKKLLGILAVVGMSIGILAGCSDAKPTDTVKEFLTTVQKGDVEKAATFVDEKDGKVKFSEMSKVTDEMDGKEMFKAVTKNYTFKEPVEVSAKDDTAEVKVDVTSVDMLAAITDAMGETMSTAMQTAFKEGKEPSQKEMEETMMKAMVEKLGDKDTKMVTREVTLNLKKDTDGNYKIISDEKLAEAIIANFEELDKQLGQ
jgi:hypothetical protein